MKYWTFSYVRRQVATMNVNARDGHEFLQPFSDAIDLQFVSIAPNNQNLVLFRRMSGTRNTAVA